MTIVDGTVVVGPEDEEGGSGQHKAYRDKLAMHQVTSQPTVRDGQNLTLPRHASREHQPPSLSGGAAVTCQSDWSPHHGNAFNDHHREPSLPD
jgi:monoamine oxidase